VKAGMTHVNDQLVNDLQDFRSAAKKTAASAVLVAIGSSRTDHWVNVQHQSKQYPF